MDKKLTLLLGCLLLITSITGCAKIFGTDNPEIKLKVERTGKANEIKAMSIQSLSVRAYADVNQYLISPNNVKIAFTKVWFPNQAGYDLLVSTTTKKSDFRLIKDAEAYRDYCIIVVDKPESDPEIFDLDEGGFGFTSSIIPPEDTYYGVIVELFYYEFEIENLGSIRWYEPDYEGAWQTKKIMIKLKDSSEWKYAYRKYGSGIVLETEAKTRVFWDDDNGPHPGQEGSYFSLVKDKWRGDCTILMSKAFHNMHSDTSSFTIRNIDKLISIKYTLTYSLSVDNGGGMEFYDLNDDMKFDINDFGIQSSVYIMVCPWDAIDTEVSVSNSMF